jgi:ATP-dependent RNA helicase DDX56/DBP9
VPQADKLLATMALLKLGLVRKKVLLFVNSVDSGYRLKLFLESFGIRAALLNAELPLNSRCGRGGGGGGRGS